jgi:acyl-CoA synthetase (AMP-forming)/AMP-acid ligase II
LALAQPGQLDRAGPELRRVRCSHNDILPSGGSVAAAGPVKLLAPASPVGRAALRCLGVQHSDGYVELRDRAKDIIISGGENISTIEVEQALVRHPDVLEAAVVAIADAKWGERPKAFVTLRDGAAVTETELIAFSRETLPGFKAPSEIEFGELPKTSTGKIKKYELRERERQRQHSTA